MRKHHNKLYFGTYTHKAVFSMPWANKLYPTSTEHLEYWSKDEHYPSATSLAKFGPERIIGLFKGKISLTT